MNETNRRPEVPESRHFVPDGFREIKPETDISSKEAVAFWNKTFAEKELLQTLDDYFDDLKSNSQFPKTFSDKPFDASDLKRISSEENSRMREEFVENKRSLIKEWESQNNCSWPTYTEDVWISNKYGETILIRQAGSRYDAHHIQPLGMGGKNEASNITPLSADIHYDHQGVHALGSPYDRLDKMLGGV